MGEHSLKYSIVEWPQPRSTSCDVYGKQTDKQIYSLFSNQYTLNVEVLKYCTVGPFLHRHSAQRPLAEFFILQEV
jgi:hypothetical protein